MAAQESFENTESSKLSPKSVATGNDIRSESFNELFKLARGGGDEAQLSALPAADNLLHQIKDGKPAQSGEQADDWLGDNKVQRTGKGAPEDDKPMVLPADDKAGKNDKVPTMETRVENWGDDEEKTNGPVTLEQQHKKPHAQQDKTSHNDKAADKPATGMEGIGKIIGELMKDIKEQEARQKKIAEAAIKDPNVQKVTEKHIEGLAPTVIVETKDGKVITYEPEGTKTTDDGTTKVIEYPKSVDPNVSMKIEYENGAVETRYRDGSNLVVTKKGDGFRTSKDGVTTHIAKDGTERTTLKDGTEIVLTPDGTKTTTKPDGTEIVEKKNGDRTVSKPEHVEADGTKVWHKDDGTEIRESKDGKRTTVYPEDVNEKIAQKVEYPNGDLEQTSRDGTVVVVKHDGDIEVRNTDGSGSIIHKNGDMEFKNADGSSFKIAHDGSMTTVKADGTSTTVHPSGLIETKNPDGSMQLTTRDGFSMKLNADGTMEAKMPEEMENANNRLKGWAALNPMADSLANYIEEEMINNSMIGKSVQNWKAKHH